MITVHIIIKIYLLCGFIDMFVYCTGSFSNVATLWRKSMHNRAGLMSLSSRIVVSTVSTRYVIDSLVFVAAQIFVYFSVDENRPVLVLV
jgi:hypothetical protein